MAQSLPKHDEQPSPDHATSPPTSFELTQRRLLNAVRASPAVLLKQDRELRFTSVVNPSPPLTEADVLGKTELDFFPCEQAEEMQRMKRDVMASGQAARHVVTCTLRGQVSEYLFIIEPDRNERGEVIGVSCFLWNLTREQAVERALQNSHAQLCSLVAEAPTSMALLDKNFRYLAASRSWVKNYGRGRTELVGCYHYDVWPDAPETWKQIHREALAGKHFSGDDELWEFPDGTKSWLRWAVYPWRDIYGEVGGIVFSIDDISEQKRAVEALKVSEEKFRMMAETVPDMLFITRADGYSEYLNEGYYSATGLERGSGRGDGWIESIHPDDRERIMKAWMTAVTNGEPYEARLRIVNMQKGTVRWYVARALPMRNEAGEIVRWFGCGTDIEDQVREAALRETDRRKDEFLAMLSHELRNPLAAIRSASYVLEHAHAGEASGQNAREVIKRQTTYLTRIVDDLLDITRVTRGKIQIEKRPLELGAIVQRTVDDYLPEYESRKVELDCWLGSKQVWVDGDATRLVQVIGNLLNNAVKFTPAGGHVEVFLKCENKQAVLRVRDTGCGIPPEKLNALFEPFTQIEFTLDSGRGGLGLGLALVKGIVELHGGSVSVSSAGRGQGAELTVKLPLTTPQERQDAPQKASLLLKRRVLVIEDNIDNAESMKQVLQLLGQDVHVAHDGISGIALARALQPDVVLCDIGLPGMSGLDVARQMRSEEAFRKTRLVALSGYGLPKDRQNTAAAGFSKHLVKPVAIEDLERLIAEDAGGD
ncbi:MAG: PAS domain-containing protein [Polyangiaceae bacterium]|nr:PAS domain-containing protein [Polyangiaceae bacterium]